MTRSSIPFASRNSNPALFVAEAMPQSVTKVNVFIMLKMYSSTSVSSYPVGKLIFKSTN